MSEKDDMAGTVCEALEHSPSVMPVSVDQLRLVWSAGRRLDAGHLQLERICTSIANMPPDGSMARGEAVHAAIGEVELMVIALSKALDIAAGDGQATTPDFACRVLDGRGGCVKGHEGRHDCPLGAHPGTARTDDAP